MPNFLLIESSSKNCSVAVADEQRILAIQEESSDQYVHSEKMHVFIKEVVEQSGLVYEDLDAIGVGKGPGSYTGLRIGVSAAKGLCYALNIPLIAIDSLSILAASKAGNVEDGVIVPLMDARRMEVYQAVFTKEGEMQGEISAKILDETSYVDLLGATKVHFVGDAVEKAQTVIQHPNAVFHESVKYPSVEQMKALCAKKFNERAFEDVAYFEPYYLKDFVAGKPKKVL